eukprot:Ihof_evm7s291 gene=Ihof_evmTU7s291
MIWLHFYYPVDHPVPMIRNAIYSSRSDQPIECSFILYERPMANHHMAIKPIFLTWPAKEQLGDTPTSVIEAVLNQINISKECDQALVAAIQSESSVYQHISVGKPMGHNLLISPIACFLRSASLSDWQEHILLI